MKMRAVWERNPNSEWASLLRWDRLCVPTGQAGIVAGIVHHSLKEETRTVDRAIDVLGGLKTHSFVESTVSVDSYKMTVTGLRASLF